jgi:hypothetical protein
MNSFVDIRGKQRGLFPVNLMSFADYMHAQSRQAYHGHSGAYSALVRIAGVIRPLSLKL